MLVRWGPLGSYVRPAHLFHCDYSTFNQVWVVVTEPYSFDDVQTLNLRPPSQRSSDSPMPSVAAIEHQLVNDLGNGALGLSFVFGMNNEF